jgi:transcriptional regulator with XRE-family HTH domain
MINPIDELLKLTKVKTQRQVADDLGVSAQYLTDVLKDRRAPGKKILDGLGLERLIIYRKRK